jgi:hypothetical protein
MRSLMVSSSGSPTVLHVLEANGSEVIPVLWQRKRRCTTRMLQRRPGHKAVARCAARVVENYGASCADPMTSRDASVEKRGASHKCVMNSGTGGGAGGNRLWPPTSEFKSIESILFLSSGVRRLLRPVRDVASFYPGAAIARPYPAPVHDRINDPRAASPPFLRVSSLEMSQLRGRRASVRCGCGRG